MLEILALWALTKKIGSVVEAKGHKSGWYKVLTVILWFGGELVGAFIGAFLNNGETCTIYAIAIVGAAIGAGIAYLIANSVPDQQSPQTPVPPAP